MLAQSFQSTTEEEVRETVTGVEVDRLAKHDERLGVATQVAEGETVQIVRLAPQWCRANHLGSQIGSLVVAPFCNGRPYGDERVVADRGMHRGRSR